MLCGETPQCDGCPLRSCCEYGSLLRPPPASAPGPAGPSSPAGPAGPTSGAAAGPTGVLPDALPPPKQQPQPQLQLAPASPLHVEPTAAEADVTMADAAPPAAAPATVAIATSAGAASLAATAPPAVAVAVAVASIATATAEAAPVAAGGVLTSQAALCAGAIASEGTTRLSGSVSSMRVVSEPPPPQAAGVARPVGPVGIVHAVVVRGPAPQVAARAAPLPHRKAAGDGQYELIYAREVRDLVEITYKVVGSPQS